MSRRYLRLLFVFSMFCFVLALGPVSEAAAPIEVREVTFAHGLTEDHQPIDRDASATFTSDQTIYLSVVLAGRPKEGIATARFYWHDELVGEAGVDLAELNSGVVFSIGQDTNIGYTLSPNQPWHVSNNHAEVYLGDELLGTYPYYVVPPPDAIPVSIDEVVTALGADENYIPVDPTNEFFADESVYLVGRGDLGTATWAQAKWYVNGVYDEAGSRNFTIGENSPAAGFSFSYLPVGGWATGVHSATLTVNDELVGAYEFAVEEPLFNKAAFMASFRLPTDGEIVEEGEGYDAGFATMLAGQEVLELYDAALTEEGWQLVGSDEAAALWETEGAELYMEVQGQDDQGRTIVWLEVAKMFPEMEEPADTGFSGTEESADTGFFGD